MAAAAAAAVAHTSLFLLNGFRPASTGATLPITDPSTDAVIAHVADASSVDVDAAVRAAHAAFHGVEWGAFDGPARARLLSRLADLLALDADVFAQLEALDCGKPLAMARLADVASSVRVLRYHAALAEAGCGRGGRVLAPPSSAVGDTALSFTSLAPIGVVAGIVGFNFPLCGVVAKLAPAIAAGCTIVLKPSHQCPLSALALAALSVKAGFPPGVLAVLPGGRATGAALVAHPLVSKVSFTGSCAVGKAIGAACAARCIRFTLELGGKNALIVAPDADVEAAAHLACGANFFNAGQICVGMSRVYVPDALHDAFVAAAVKRARARVLGSPWDAATEQGPLVDGVALARVLAFIAAGVQGGATIATGGQRWGSTGCFVEPTILVGLDDANVCAREEIFGPVMSVLRYGGGGDNGGGGGGDGSLPGVIARANAATPFGLAACVVTSDVGAALTACAKLRAGTVWVNCHGG